MSDKVTLVPIQDLNNQTTAINAINSNSVAITTAMDNTFSLDGTAPNQLKTNVDMNSNRILNLPAPIAMTEPLRVVDADTLNGGGTITVEPLPTGGTVSQVLTKNSSTNFDTSWQNVTLTGNVSASQLPAFTGDVTTTAGTVATTISAGAVTNSKQASMAAFTLKGNATSSSATPTDITIGSGSLTQKGSPVSNDTVMIGDSAASGALKYATVGSISSIGSVSSVGGATGAITLGGGLSISGTVLSDSWSTGDIKWTVKTSPDTGWIIPTNSGTIGNASSGGTVRANADTSALFQLFWNTCSNTICPVSGGRGGSAASDFASNKTITLPNMPSRTVGIAGTGDATTRAVGATAGSETTSLVTSNLPAYTPAGTVSTTLNSIGSNQLVYTAGGTNTPGGGSNETISGGINAAFTSTFSGSAQGGTSSPFSVIQPTVYFNVMIKL